MTESKLNIETTKPPVIQNIPLFMKYSKQYEDVLIDYLNQGGDPNGVNAQGWPYLCIVTNYVSSTASLKILKALLEHGANPNSIVPISQTSALHCSILQGYEVTQILLNSGAQVNIKDINGVTPLMLACMWSQHQVKIETIELLINHGGSSQVNDYDNSGWGALLYVCNNARENSNLAIAQLLLEHGAEIDHREAKGYTPLMLCTLNSHSCSNLDTVEWLLKAGADVNAYDNDGRSVLAKVTHELVCNPDHQIDPTVCIALIRYCQSSHHADDVNESLANLMRDKENKYKDISHLLFRYYMVLGTPEEKTWWSANVRRHSFSKTNRKID